MNTKLLAAIVLAALTSGAAAQPTAFSYQGRLKNGTQPASGLHDFQFRLFGSATGGSQLGPTSCVNNVLVTDGLFTATLDFGPGGYGDTGPRFLEVEVRADSGLDCSNGAGFLVLAPRSPLAPVPMAAHASGVFALDAPDGSHPGAVSVNNAGKVGVGTSSPQATLHLVTPGEGVRIQGAAPGNANQAWIGFFDSFGTRIGYVGDGSTGDSSMYLASDAGDVRLSTAAGAVVTAKPNGNVGIGTPSPSTRLDVRGDIRLGPSGEYRAAAGLESLRIIYGVIDFDGAILSGPGFSVTHPSQGVYNISFNAPFSGTPTVTATVMHPAAGASTAFAMAQSITSSAVTLEVFQRSDGSFFNQSVQFIAIGPR